MSLRPNTNMYLCMFVNSETTIKKEKYTRYNVQTYMNLIELRYDENDEAKSPLYHFILSTEITVVCSSVIESGMLNLTHFH